jgi:hypothetical protein
MAGRNIERKFISFGLVPAYFASALHHMEGVFHLKGDPPPIQKAPGPVPDNPDVESDLKAESVL